MHLWAITASHYFVFSIHSFASLSLQVSGHGKIFSDPQLLDNSKHTAIACLFMVFLTEHFLLSLTVLSLLTDWGRWLFSPSLVLSNLSSAKLSPSQFTWIIYVFFVHLPSCRIFWLYIFLTLHQGYWRLVLKDKSSAAVLFLLSCW